MFVYAIDFFEKNVDIIFLYANKYTLISFCLFYVLGFIWYRFYAITYFQKILKYIWLWVMLPGTIAHEFMHFIVGVIFNAKPVGFSLIPKKTEGGYTLGSVYFSNINLLNAVPVSMAPFLLIPFSFFLIVFFSDYFLQDNFHKALAGFFLYNLWISSIPSSTDFKVSLTNPLSIVFYAILGFVFYNIIHRGF